MKTVRISKMLQKILSKRSEYLWRWNSFDFLQKKKKESGFTLSFFAFERANAACLIDETEFYLDLLFSLLSNPPATHCSTICSICVQLYSPVTQHWEGGFLLRSTLWQLHGIEVTCFQSSLFAAGVFSFKYINSKSKSDWWCEGKNIINIVEV